MLLKKEHYDNIESLSDDSKLLILSCSRSGTKYTSQFFQQMGIPFGHEKPLEKGGIGWNLLLNNIINTNDKHTRDVFDFEFAFHQVRNPLQVLRSLPTHVRSMYGCIEKVIGSLPRDPLLRAMHYWVKWNNLCLNHSSFTYKVEDLFVGSDLHLFFNRFFGATSSVGYINNKTNTRRGKIKYINNINLNYIKVKDPYIYNEFLILCDMLEYKVI